MEEIQSQMDSILSYLGEKESFLNVVRTNVNDRILVFQWKRRSGCTSKNFLYASELLANPGTHITFLEPSSRIKDIPPTIEFLKIRNKPLYDIKVFSDGYIEFDNSSSITFCNQTNFHAIEQPGSLIVIDGIESIESESIKELLKFKKMKFIMNCNRDDNENVQYVLNNGGKYFITRELIPIWPKGDESVFAKKTSGSHL